MLSLHKGITFKMLQMRTASKYSSRSGGNVLSEKREVVITVNKVHLHNILAGRKSVELRKRWTSIAVGTLWLCEKGSGGKVVGKASIDRSVYLDVDEGWQLHSENIGVTRCQYLDYVGENERVHYIFLSETERVVDMGLEDLGIGRPPQNFTFVRS